MRAWRFLPGSLKVFHLQVGFFQVAPVWNKADIEGYSIMKDIWHKVYFSSYRYIILPAVSLISHTELTPGKTFLRFHIRPWRQLNSPLCWKICKSKPGSRRKKKKRHCIVWGGDQNVFGESLGNIWSSSAFQKFLSLFISKRCVFIHWDVWWWGLFPTELSVQPLKSGSGWEKHRWASVMVWDRTLRYQSANQHSLLFSVVDQRHCVQTNLF